MHRPLLPPVPRRLSVVAQPADCISPELPNVVAPGCAILVRRGRLCPVLVGMLPWTRRDLADVPCTYRARFSSSYRRLLFFFPVGATHVVRLGDRVVVANRRRRLRPRGRWLLLALVDLLLR